LKRQLNQVVIHEQVENGVAIYSNLNVDQIDRLFVTPKRVSQSKQKHMWTKERLAGHRTPQATSIIPHEMQIGEA
jgi:hypothetical protein